MWIAQTEQTRHGRSAFEHLGELPYVDLGSGESSEKARTGAVYRLDLDGTPHRIFDGLGIPDTLAWSANSKTMYFAETLDRTVYAFDSDPATGTPWRRRVFAIIPGPGYPDSSTIDEYGHLWNGEWDSGASSATLAYQRAYGASQGETVNSWIKQVEWPTWVSGLDAISTYNRYGVMFGFALAVVVFCLVVVVRSRRGKGKRERRGWLLTVGGLGAVAAGSLSEYGIPEDLFDSSNGFALSMLGFLFIMIGTPVLGWAVYSEAGVGRLQAIGIAVIGPLGVIIGTAINGYLPGGPATPIIIAAIIIGITGLPDTARP